MWLVGSGGLEFEDPGAVFELVAGVEFGVVARAGLPHFPEDLQPALAEAAQRTGVAFAALAQRLVIDRRPRDEVARLLSAQRCTACRRLVAVPPQMDFVDLPGLVADRRRAGQALRALGILEARAIRADLAEQPRGESWARRRAVSRRGRVGMLGEELLDLGR